MTPYNSGFKTGTFKILRLKNKSLWLEEQVSTDSLVEYHYLSHSEE